MVDIFPFPRVTGETPEKQITELISYLIQFKETLEFELANISTENLSPDLVAKLDSLNATIEQSNLEKEDEIAQIANKTSQFASASAFSLNRTKPATEEELSQINFSVNFETGNLEYTINT